MTINTLLDIRFDRCKAKLDALKIPYSKDTSIRSKDMRAFGLCKRDTNTNKYEITIRRDLINIDTINGLDNTIYHELLHTCPGCMNHKKKWKSYASIVSNEIGSVITARNTYSSKGLEPPGAKYVFECMNCGQKVFRFKKSKFVKEYEFYRCGVCNGKFRRIIADDN